MKETPEKAKQYNRIRVRLKLFDFLFLIVYLVLFQSFVSVPLKDFSLSLTSNFYYAFSIYITVFCVLNYLVSFPLNVYSSFMLERKFDLSNQKFLDWIKDDFKKGVLSLLIFLVFIHALYIFLERFQATWWIWIAAFWFCATIILAKITPTFILPLFFKYMPVKEELKERIISLAGRCGIKVINVYKIDFSKKTKKLNAAVIGLGSTRRVILADNLVDEFTTEEIDGVLAHEFAHHKLRHMWKLIAFGLLSTFLSFYVLFIASSWIAERLNAVSVHDMKIFPAFMLVLFIVGFLSMPLQNGFSRKLEKDADIFALKVTENKNVFISLMKKLASKNLADMNPPKLVRFLFYDHPPISERIELAEKY